MRTTFPRLFRGFPLEKDVFPLRATMEAELSEINFIPAMEGQEGERALRRIVSAYLTTNSQCVRVRVRI